MQHLLPSLHKGHAPIFLQEAFNDALDAFEDWRPDMLEPEVDCDGRAIPITVVFGGMRDCTDDLPARAVYALEAVTGDSTVTKHKITYAEAAVLMGALSAQRQHH
ncbi:hypothetical protein [Tianweitania sediminis]|jgi:hypothetical protein|uniref:Uncharacterized protein n=1 Tax=Tianweitania sediminis TaxID=1502156 RepID=A0A8J7R1U7_9HYPH|nr:hypothetical protein [Tianweitania sediminis]MBP0438640.1 hypothetical protein [Tianweitania sediminis]HEV7417891.1 hypothetical protein [Tianweitania sediminis]